ncbi:MAG: ATP-binding protein [Lachnospiraceae bacterium]|nr:ATP-binding protein [Lachnospiraceae bacterium]
MHISNEIYNQVIKEYDEKKRLRDYLIQSRIDELREKVPGYLEADLEVSKNASVFLDKFLSSQHNDKERTDYHNLIEEVKAKKLSLMKKAGYPADFLDPPYECATCRDTGYVDGETCHCFRQKLLDRVFLQEPLIKQLSMCELSDFSLEYYPRDTYDKTSGIDSYSSAQKALEDAGTFINEFDKRHGNLIIYGSTGAGKTFLSCCIGNAINRQGYTVVYQTANRFFNIISDFTFRRDGGGHDKYKSIFESDLLILDDLGTELSNSFTNSAVFDCINDRIINGRSTIISTNLSAQEIFDTYTGRVFSRLSNDYIWLHLFGTDVRIRSKKLQ